VLDSRNPATLQLRAPVPGPAADDAPRGLPLLELDEPGDHAPAGNPNATLGLKPVALPPAAAVVDLEAPPAAPRPRVATPRPAPQTAAEFVEQLPPNPTLPRSLKLAFGIIALLLLTLLGLWVAREALQLANRQERNKLEKELAVKDRALREKEIVGDVEAKIAGIQTRTELTTEEELRRRDLQEMIDTARQFEQQQPAELARALERYQKIQQQARGTRFELLVDDDLTRVQRRLQAAHKLKQALAGTWTATRFTTPDGKPAPTVKLVLDLRADGTYTLTREQGAGSGPWAVSPETLFLYYQDQLAASWAVRLQPPTLILDRGTDRIELTRR
jgi:hypothetical protein